MDKDVLEPENRMNNPRKWGRRLTLGLLVLALLVAGPNFLACIGHSAVDSEVGVMMYGFPLLIGMIYGSPLLGVTRDRKH